MSRAELTLSVGIFVPYKQRHTPVAINQTYRSTAAIWYTVPLRLEVSYIHHKQFSVDICLKARRSRTAPLKQNRNRLLPQQIAAFVSPVSSASNINSEHKWFRQM